MKGESLLRPRLFSHLCQDESSFRAQPFRLTMEQEELLALLESDSTRSLVLDLLSCNPSIFLLLCLNLYCEFLGTITLAPEGEKDKKENREDAQADGDIFFVHINGGKCSS